MAIINYGEQIDGIITKIKSSGSSLGIVRKLEKFRRMFTDASFNAEELKEIENIYFTFLNVYSEIGDSNAYALADLIDIMLGLYTGEYFDVYPLEKDKTLEDVKDLVGKLNLVCLKYNNKNEAKKGINFYFEGFDKITQESNRVKYLLGRYGELENGSTDTSLQEEIEKIKDKNPAKLKFLSSEEDCKKQILQLKFDKYTLFLNNFNSIHNLGDAQRL